MKMNSVKILIPTLVLFILLSSGMPVLALDKTSYQYATTGQINNNGVGASMSLTLKGTLTIGTPDYSVPSSGNDENRGWNDYGGVKDWEFPWNDLSSIPDYVTNDFTPTEPNKYRVHIDWDNHEHWMDSYTGTDYGWSTPKGSWSGQLIAMWGGGGTNYETFSVSLSPWKVIKNVKLGNMHTAGDSNRHEHWAIYQKNEGGDQQVFDKNYNFPLGNSFNYYSESLQIYTNGKFTAKNKRFEGRLDFKEDKFWMNPNHIPPYGPPDGIGFGGNGDFGTYSFNFPSTK